MDDLTLTAAVLGIAGLAGAVAVHQLHRGAAASAARRAAAWGAALGGAVLVLLAVGV